MTSSRAQRIKLATKGSGIIHHRLLRSNILVYSFYLSDDAALRLPGLANLARRLRAKTESWKTKRITFQRILIIHQNGIHIIGINLGHQVYIPGPPFLTYRNKTNTISSTGPTLGPEAAVKAVFCFYLFLLLQRKSFTESEDFLLK